MSKVGSLIYICLQGHRGLDKPSDLVISKVILCQNENSGLSESSTRPLLSAINGPPGDCLASSTEGRNSGSLETQAQ